MVMLHDYLNYNIPICNLLNIIYHYLPSLTQNKIHTKKSVKLSKLNSLKNTDIKDIVFPMKFHYCKKKSYVSFE